MQNLICPNYYDSDLMLAFVTYHTVYPPRQLIHVGEFPLDRSASATYASNLLLCVTLGLTLQHRKLYKEWQRLGGELSA